LPRSAAIVPESVPTRQSYCNHLRQRARCVQCCSGPASITSVFSSTAAVYGIRRRLRQRGIPTRRSIPMGAIQLMSKWMLRDLAAAPGCGT